MEITKNPEYQRLMALKRNIQQCLRSVDAELASCELQFKSQCKHDIARVSMYDECYRECKHCGLSEYDCNSNNVLLSKLARTTFEN